VIRWGVALLAAVAASCGGDARPVGPPVELRCGDQTCDARTSYCELVLTDVPSLPSTHTCRPLPGACRPDPTAPPTCGCFPSTTKCRNFCRRIDTAGPQAFQLVCVGGG